MISNDESLKILFERREDLERRAGIFDKAENARNHPFRYVFDRPQSPEEWQDEERQESTRVRRRVRNIYFDVAELDLRRELMTLVRDVQTLWLRGKKNDLRDAEREVEKARIAVGRPPWGSATFVAGWCVVAGYYLGGLPGSIGGATVGFFLGQGTISNAKSDAQALLQEAQRNFNEMAKLYVEAESERDYFSAKEWLSGERDAQFD